ncbi:FHA domain-containing protein [Nonomuraea sp. NPDC049152]|uniref:FHA domain-containing protein n=1 Tax=Nonomuraea sp. NPDC049152 TaxID=3154350 RepID=UPI0033CBD2A5
MPRLIVIHPPALEGTVLLVGERRQVIGRGSAADLRLDDPHLSAVHAAVVPAGGGVTIEDLGSRNGTVVGQERVSRPRRLRDGDVVRLGTVHARFEDDGGGGRGHTEAMPAAVSYHVGRQEAGQLNNVAGNQYNHYVHQRDSFLRQVAAYRSKARSVFWLGILLMFGGGAGYAAVIIKGMGDIQSSFASGRMPEDFPFGPDVGLGVPIGLIAFAVGFVGNILFWVGLIMQIVAAARARRVDVDPRHSWNSPAVGRR